MPRTLIKSGNPAISKAAKKGSQLSMQRAVSTNLPELSRALAQAVGHPDSPVVWKSPLEPDYKEARDQQVFKALGIDLKKRLLRDFWPARGPVWDGLATIATEYVLVEAKAHIPELISGGTKAGEKSISQIEQALHRTRRSLAPHSKQNWASSPFFQYANRLAFLQFLREDNGIPAHLAFVYFTYDRKMEGPESVEEWKGAIRLMEASLGLSSHRLSRYVHKIFIDSRTLESVIL